MVFEPGLSYFRFSPIHVIGSEIGDGFNSSFSSYYVVGELVC